MMLKQIRRILVCRVFLLSSHPDGLLSATATLSLATTSPSTSISPVPAITSPTTSPKPSPVAILTTESPSISPKPSGQLLVSMASDLPSVSPHPSSSRPTVSPHPSTKTPTISPHPSSSRPTVSPHPSSTAPVTNPTTNLLRPTVSPYPSRPSEATQYLRSLSPTKKSSSAPSHKSEQKVASGPVFLMAFLGTAVTAFIVLSVFSVSRKRRKRPAGVNDHVGQDLSPMSRIENKNHDSSPENGAEEHDDCASKESSTLFPFSPMGQSLSISSTRDSWEPTPRTEKHNVMSPPPVITSENSAIEIQVSPAKSFTSENSAIEIQASPEKRANTRSRLRDWVLRAFVQHSISSTRDSWEPTPRTEKHYVMSPPPVITSENSAIEIQVSPAKSFTRENSAIEIQASPEKRANTRSRLRD